MISLIEYNKNNYWLFAFTISNAGEYYETGQSKTNWCMLHLAVPGHSWWFKIPEIFKPKKKWVDTSTYDWSVSKKGYWDHIKKEYGISVTNESVHLKYGIQPGSWSAKDRKNSDHTKVFFIPWTQYTFKEEAYFTADWVFYDRCTNKDTPQVSSLIRENIPKKTIRFNDFDGEEIEVECFITRREWSKGTSWCSWLKYITTPMVKWNLELNFSKEVGREKGSWKGGTIGHSVEIKEYENALDAFKRYGSEEQYYKSYGKLKRDFSNIRIVD